MDIEKAIDRKIKVVMDRLQTVGSFGNADEVDRYFKSSLMSIKNLTIEKIAGDVVKIRDDQPDERQAEGWYNGCEKVRELLNNI